MEFRPVFFTLMALLWLVMAIIRREDKTAHYGSMVIAHVWLAILWIHTVGAEGGIS